MHDKSVVPPYSLTVHSCIRPIICMDGYLNPSEKILKHGTKLPHWQQSESMQFVTFRLGDAMPQQKIRKWKDEHAIWLNIHPKPWPADLEIEYHQRFSARLERWLDEGSGSCLMRNPEIRKNDRRHTDARSRNPRPPSCMGDHAESSALAVHCTNKPREP